MSCGVHLCYECAHLITPPTCAACAKNYAAEIRNEFIKTLVFGAVLLVVGIMLRNSDILELKSFGIFIVGVPFGWRALNRITSNMFLWMPIAGWLIYFAIKFILSLLIGMIALPVYIVQQILKLKSAIAAQRISQNWKVYESRLEANQDE
jgi:hypothetical protein